MMKEKDKEKKKGMKFFHRIWKFDLHMKDILRVETCKSDIVLITMHRLDRFIIPHYMQKDSK